MKNNFKQKYNGYAVRNLIRRGEGKLTYVQLFGFVLILLGIIYFVSFLLPGAINSFLPQSLRLDDDPTSYGISLAFFTIMLGVAFAFPDMLKGQTKDISTMRIIVFMFANVICMLLLKIGWAAESLDEIGLDANWMAIIAFLFGAKATQSYFENINNGASGFHSRIKDIQGISQSAIAQIARAQNEGKLYSKYPNVQSVSDTLKEGKSCLTIYISDTNLKDIPPFVPAELNETLTLSVQTEIISNSAAATPHIGQATDELSDSDNPRGFGSICCILDSGDNPELRFIVTAGHNFTNGSFKSMKGFLFGSDQRNVLINSKVRGKLFYQRMHFTQDLAIILLNDTINLEKNYISFQAGYYELSTTDLKTVRPNVTIASRVNSDRTGPNIRDAFVLDYNIPYDIMYNGGKKRMQNVILIGNSNNPMHSKEVSLRGDSGSCVFHKDTQKLIGILVGGNGQFSFVLPLKDILESNNFRLI